MDGANCDYTSNELITQNSSFNRWTIRAYSCKQDFFQPILSNGAQLQTRTYTGDAYILKNTITYMYDGGSFTTRILPSISSVNLHSGSKEGGHLLTVKGYAWSIQEGKTALKIDNSVNCNIKTIAKDQSSGEFTATCQTESTVETNGSSFVGGQGWLHQIYKDTNSISGIRNADPPAQSDIKTLIFNSQILYNNLEATGKYVSRSRTFFKAPKSGNYYIWFSGDDSVKVYFSKTPSTIPDTWNDETDLVVNMTQVSGSRSLWDSWDPQNNKFTRRSDRIDNLVKDSYYYMQMFHSEGGGNDHAAIGLQIQNSTVENPRKLPQVQRIEFKAQPKLDEYKIVLYWGSDHSASKKFNVKFHNKNKDDEWEEKVIKDVDINSTTSQINSKFDNYFNAYFKSGLENFTVVKTYYSNEAGTTPTNVEDDALYVEFKIHMKEATNSPREIGNKLPELKSQTIDLNKSSIDFTPGEPGLKGEWKIKIVDPISGMQKETGNLKVTASNWDVAYAIYYAVPEYFLKVFVVRKSLKNNDPQKSHAGYEYFISFDEYRADIPDIKLESVDMGYGENSVYNASFDQETVQPFSDDLFFFPAPYEFFFTPHTTPQMLVTVDSKLGGCDWSTATTCDYKFLDETPEITQTTSISPFTQCDIIGTTLGASADEFEKIQWAGRSCTSLTVTDTKIECTITNPVAGSHLPVVKSKLQGNVKQTGVTEIVVAPTFTTVTPGAINNQGGQEITLTGTGFPDQTSVGTHTVSVTVGGIQCAEVIKVSATSMKCKSGAGIPINGDQDIVVTINGQSVTKNAAITVNQLGSSATVLPIKMNATEKGTLTVTINNLNEDLSDTSKFDIKLIKADHTVKMRAFQQTFAANTNEIKVKYPGGKIGEYTLVVDHADKGTLSDGNQTFRVGAKITAISVNQGSLNGGTEITITGELFHPTQSIIKVGYNDCIVQGVVSDTQVTCITPRTTSVNPLTGDLIDSKADVAVVVNLTQDAECTIGGGCLFDWKDTLTPKLSLTAWSANTLTITGQGFGSNKSNVKVELSGLEQQVDTVSNTQVVVTANNLKSRSEKLQLRVRVVGKGYALVPKAHYEHNAPGSITYTGLAPSTDVSEGGQNLTITGTGFASDITASLKDKDSADQVCTKVTYVSFTELKCQSTPGTKNYSGTTLVIESSNKTCGGCSIATSATSPTLTSIADSGYSGNDQTLALTGTNFPNGGETVVAVKVSDTIVSSSATINSATSIDAVFTNGIGFGTGIKIQSIEFSDGSFAKIDGAATVDQTLNGTPTTSLNCSFAGGCLWSYDNPNVNSLSSSLSATVCNLPCLHDSDKSTINSFKCRAPVMATKKSITTYSKLIESKSWQNFNSQEQTLVSVYSNDPSTFGKEAFDNDVSNKSGTGQENCYLGLQITDSGHVGTIDSVRYFFPRTLNADKYVGGKFQVSNDGGSTWSDLFTIEKTPMEGWNSWDRINGEATAGANDTFNVIKYIPSDPTSSECNFMEIEVKGKVVRSQTTTTVTCPVKVKRGQEELVSENSGVIYNEANTPMITSLSKTNISAQGGETVTINGSGFSATTTVTIDGIECPFQSVGAGNNSVVCTTGKRAAPSVKPFTVEVGTNGYAANQGNKFMYILNWSDPDAWGGEYSPGDGDSISIPAGQNLVFDIDKGPLLKALIVEGSLLFYPQAVKTHKRTFDAEYVFVKGGLLQIGTEAAPYDSELTITMHGTKKSIEIPIYGNKVIAVRDGGVLQMHGDPKIPSWTDLYTTADVGATTMQINIDNTSGTDFNWKAGDVMVLAPTDFDFREAEELTIVSIVLQNANSRPEVTFTPALKYKHYAGVQTFPDSSSIEMRAEVGVLTRNVVFQGDPMSQENQYGAHIMIHSPGDESVEGRIENIELTQVGQAFQLGRYPLHFHMIGRVTKSYIKNNAIHHTYNRACTLHGVHYLLIQGNVAYYTMGHTFFIEDAAETKNRIIRNLAIRSEASNSLLNTDQSPASFWITHPDNIFRDNHAAGAARYGFWFDMQDTAIGPSFDPNICPGGERLGEFNGNVAHSNGRYGLRIFHFHIPRTHPCKAISVSPPEGSANPEDDAYAENPPIPAVYENYTGYKNNRNAVIAEEIGAVQFKNIKTADNLFAGIETTLPGFAKLDQGFLDGALIVGFSQNAGDVSRYTRAKGIIAGQRDSFTFKNVKFHNFDSNTDASGNAGISTCSHCAHVLDPDGIANTSAFQGLTFNDVTKKILFSSHRDAIIHDIDGSLSGAGGERWITPSKPHHQIDGVCTEDADLDTSSVCTSPIRKILFKNPVKINELKGQKMKIALAANVPVVPEGQDDVTWTADMHSKYSQIGQNHKKTGQWEIPFVLGQHYNVHWQYGIDWEGFKAQRSKLFKANDPGFLLQFNYTDRRDEFRVNARAKVQNITTENAVLDYATASDSATQVFGAHINDLTKKIWSVLFNNKPNDAGLGLDKAITVSTIRCTGGCTTFKKVVVEDRVRSWSVPTDWEDEGDAPGSGKVPLAGQQATVKGNWNMVYDVESANAVNLKKVFIEGRLTFKDPDSADKHYELKSEWIILESGELIIGTEETAYKNKVTITLLGTPNQDAYAYSNNIMAGNKILFVTGKLFINGGDIIEGGNTHTKLLAKGVKGQSSLTVESGLKWKTGHKIALAPSGYDYKQHEMKEIATYDDVTGALTLTTPLSYDHYGAAAPQTYQSHTYDLRTEVGHLTRNVIIQGEENERWGGQIFITEFKDTISEVIFAGTATLKNVQVIRMSQYDTQRAAFRTSKIEQRPIVVDRCSFHETPAWAFNIGKSKDITITNNVIYGTHRNAIKVHGANTFKMNNNLFINNDVREFDSLMLKDHQVAVDLCTGENSNTCSKMQVQNNVVAGGKGIGFLIPSSDCDDQASSQQWFKNNRVHSTEVGMIPATNSAASGKCGLLKNFEAHHNYLIAITSYFTFDKLVLKNIVLTENAIGVMVGIGKDSNTQGQIILQDSLVIGEHADSRDCSLSFEKSKTRKVGIMSSIGGAIHSVPFTYPPLGFFMMSVNPGRGKETIIQNVVFKDFIDPASRCKEGSPISVMQIHQEGSDLLMPHIFKNVKFDSVASKGFIFLMDAPQGWINPTDCVDFVCTGPRNMLLQFRDGVTDTSNALGLPLVPFDIIANNSGINQALGTCSFKSDWNSNLCQGDIRALLEFQSRDGDKLDRSVVPIFITNKSFPKYNNKLNSFMDHVWDGFYTGQKRLSRFVSVVRTDSTDFTEVEFTGTPPLSQLYELYAAKSKTQHLKIKIDYPKPEAVRVKLGSVELGQQQLINGVPAQLTGKNCGENRWTPQLNILEFTLIADPKACSLTLITKQSIQITFRIEMTINEFFSNNHQTTFVNRLSASLGIETHRIRVVGVTEGSVVIHSQVTQNESVTSEANQIQEIKTLSQTLNQLANDGTALGDWKVLDFSMQVRTHEGGSVSEQEQTKVEQSDGLSIGIIVLIVVGCVIFVTVIVLVIVIVLHRRKPKVMFSTVGDKANNDNMLFEKAVHPLHTEDNISGDEKKMADQSCDKIERSPVNNEDTPRIEEVSV